MKYEQTQPVAELVRKPWTLKEACALFRVCDKTVRKWIDCGRLRRVPDCAKVFITDDSIRSLASGMVR
jgi:predicted site-specific integrase-resolvase